MSPTKKKASNDKMSQKKGWAILILAIVLVYIFGAWVGPWLQHHIYGMDQIVTVMEDNNIDGGAYYYTEIDAAYDGQAYLNQSLQQMAPDHYGLTLPFISGIIFCLIILYFGFRSLPR